MRKFLFVLMILVAVVFAGVQSASAGAQDILDVLGYAKSHEIVGRDGDVMTIIEKDNYDGVHSIVAFDNVSRDTTMAVLLDSTGKPWILPGYYSYYHFDFDVGDFIHWYGSNDGVTWNYFQTTGGE